MADLKFYDIIVRPIQSEKSFAGIEQKRYTFEVALKSNKSEIKKAVEAIFGVKVKKVNTMIVRGKLKRQQGGRSQGYTSDYKKAIVILEDDSKEIEFFKGLA